MKILKIEISEPKIRKRSGTPYCMGRITIGDFYESFYMFLSTWKKKDYLQQWNEGLERIKTHDRSCLIGSVLLFENNLSMEIYYLYKVDGKILVQNQMYRPEVFKDLQKEPLPFDQFVHGEERYKNIPPIEYIDEDGNKLQLWEADLNGICTE